MSLSQEASEVLSSAAALISGAGLDRGVLDGSGEGFTVLAALRIAAAGSTQPPIWAGTKAQSQAYEEACRHLTLVIRKSGQGSGSIVGWGAMPNRTKEGVVRLLRKAAEA